VADGNRYSTTEPRSNTIYFENGVVAHYESECCKCTLLEDQLEEVLDELSSFKLINFCMRSPRNDPPYM
jgi:hypothetical protein